MDIQNQYLLLPLNLRSFSCPVVYVLSRKSINSTYNVLCSWIFACYISYNIYYTLRTIYVRDLKFDANVIGIYLHLCLYNAHKAYNKLSAICSAGDNFIPTFSNHLLYKNFLLAYYLYIFKARDQELLTCILFCLV